MSSFRYQKIDAFTAGGSLGNPAACLYLKAGQALSPSEMLGIARQHKGFVSEVVYCAQEEGRIHLTYYSSECEVDFCGHGTIACLYGLIKARPDLLACPEIRIGTNRKGPLTVYNRIAEQDAVMITAPSPMHLGTEVDAEVAAHALGVPTSAINPERPIDRIDAGLRTLIVPIRTLAEETTVFPDIHSLRSFCEEAEADILLIYAEQAAQPGYFAHTRVFAPRFGYLEDPATGSGNSAFGYYLLKNGLWGGEDIRIEQGGADRVYNRVHLSCADGVVRFGGSATLRIDGVYHT